MAVIKIHIDEFLPLLNTLPVLDVRSPGEYSHAHIPGAVSFPLFTNEERRVVGTAYKQESREKAIKIGLAAFGKNLVGMVEEAERLTGSKAAPAKEVVVHCWRGGMRSAAVAWLLDLYGFKVYQLTGGYKAFRGWALKQFEKKYPLSIIGGYSGSNKTGIIQELKKTQACVIDLEELANHKGSAFGNLKRLEQPSQEHFENMLALQLFKASFAGEHKNIWIEYESQRIGQINLPVSFFNYYIGLPYYFINVPFELRLTHIIKGYSAYPKESLVNAIIRITKKLGGLEAKTAVNCLMDDDVNGCFTVLLKYYDKLYHKNEAKRKQEQRKIIYIDSNTTDAAANLKNLLKYANTQ